MAQVVPSQVSAPDDGAGGDHGTRAVGSGYDASGGGSEHKCVGPLGGVGGQVIGQGAGDGGRNGDRAPPGGGLRRPERALACASSCLRAFHGDGGVGWVAEVDVSAA